MIPICRLILCDRDEVTPEKHPSTPLTEKRRAASGIYLCPQMRGNPLSRFQEQSVLEEILGLQGWEWIRFE